MDKIKLGIPGLDEILNGGIREGSMILFSGQPGTGKSIASMQFIISGAKKASTACLSLLRKQQFH